MSRHKKHVVFSNRILMVGFGSIGQGVLPLLLRHIDIKPSQITVITADENGGDEAREYGVEFIVNPLTKENYLGILEARLKEGDFVINLSVDVGSADLIAYCKEHGVLYIDTCVEGWPGCYFDPNVPPKDRSNYSLREGALKVGARYPGGSTAILAHGANPGLVSHFIKQAFLNMAEDTGLKIAKPTSRIEWAKLAQKLGIKVIHIAERDTQVADRPKEPGEFVNTWSIDGFFGEGTQPSELGWGTHEKHWPTDGRRYGFGCDSAIYLDRPGYTTRVRSWTPLEGPYQGFLISHHESISLADWLTIPNGVGPLYRPTCHYAYHPCDDAVLSLYELHGKNGKLQERRRLIVDEIVKGTDELGVLLMGNKKGVYWYGSRLTIEEARRLVPYNNATSLQVTAGVLGAVIWAIENPRRGVVEAEGMDHERFLEIVTPYLGEVVGVWGDWSPLQGRNYLFAEDLDTSDPWQFKNIRIN
jgi:homospermidine synthase